VLAVKMVDTPLPPISCKVFERDELGGDFMF